MRILLVEDDPMIGESVSEWLQGDGYAVDWLQDGDSALLALHTTPFALVILDLGLPGRDGLEVLKEIRSKESHIPRVTPWMTVSPGSIQARMTI